MKSEPATNFPFDATPDILDWVKQHVNVEEEELIWLGHPPRQFAPSASFFFFLLISIVVLVMTLSMFWQRVLTAEQILISIEFICYFTFLLASVATTSYGIWKMVHYYRSQEYVIYGFTDKKVFWVHDRKVNELTWKEISKLHLVGRNDKPEYFTIHFQPNKKIDFIGYNYEKSNTRPFPTFELIWRGDEVYEKVMELWKKGIA